MSAADEASSAEAPRASLAPTAAPKPLRWKLPLALFLATVASTLFVGALTWGQHPLPRREISAALRGAHPAHALAAALTWLAQGWWYAGPLLLILLCHEFGHYVMARRHGVPATLPMFLPVPSPPFGTMGAVIRMRGRIRSRDALLDIGAAGPLAGLAIALPLTYIGLVHSPVRPVPAQGAWMEEGTSLLYALLKLLAKGDLPANQQILLHPVAMAGWVGLFVTMINLVPYGQLDGGHVAYALFGRAHDRVVRFIPWGLVALGATSGLYWGRVLSRAGRDPWEFGAGYTQGLNWFVFALLTWALHRGTGGMHPPTDDDELSPGRRVVAALTLVLFVLLFMPVPLRIDGAL